MADTDCTYVFVGYSGAEPKKTPKFESDEDPDKTFYRVGETLRDAIKLSFPNTTVILLRAWSQKTMLDALAKPGNLPKPIRQIHVVSHAGSALLSLSYHYDHQKRMEAFAREYVTALELFPKAVLPLTDKVKLYAAMTTLAKADPLVAGYFKRLGTAWMMGSLAEKAAEMTKDTQLRIAIKTRLMDDAYVHIWGCRSGNPFASYDVSGAPPFTKQLFDDLGKLFEGNSGIARELAMELGVPVTAVQGDGGSSFWVPEKGGKGVRPTTTTDNIPKPPTWMWRTRHSTWVTFDKDGKERGEVMMFQKGRKSPIDGGKVVGVNKNIEPPSWYLDSTKKPTLG